MINESTCGIGNKSNRKKSRDDEQTGQTTVEEQASTPGGIKSNSDEISHPGRESPSNGYRVRPSVDTIPCPYLAAAYNNGDLRPEPDGTLSTRQLDETLASIGVGRRLRAILVKGADNTDDIPDSLNLFELRGSSLAHTGGTGIRNPKIDPARLDDLLSFGKDGRMYEKHFAAAANALSRRDPGLKGTLTETFEFTAVLQVFGRVDDRGRRYLTDTDIKGLWLDGRYPEGWEPPRPDSIGLGTILARFDIMGLDRILAKLHALVKRLFGQV